MPKLLFLDSIDILIIKLIEKSKYPALAVNGITGAGTVLERCPSPAAGPSEPLMGLSSPALTRV